MYRDVETQVLGIKAHITYPEKKGKVTLSGYLIDAKTGIRIDGISTVRRTASSSAEIEIAIGYVVNALISKYNPVKKVDRGMRLADKLDESSEIVQAYKQLKESQRQVNNWADSTQTAAMAYFERNVLPEIQYCTVPEDFSADDCNRLRELLREDSLADARSRKSLKNADAGANQHLYEARVIYSELLDLNPSLPELEFLCVGRMRRAQVEQIKALPATVQRSFRGCVEEIVNDDPKLARAATIMESCALRTSEAAAVTENEIDDYGEFIVVNVLYREHKGGRVPQLKSKHGYRRVVADDWGCYMIRLCNSIIGPEDASDPPVLASDLSRSVKDALICSGCDEQYIREANRTMQDNPEFDEFGNPYADTMAYILRRNRASIWKNICGLSQKEIDYLLGHKPLVDTKVKFNINDIDLLRTWHKKMARFDLSPEVSTNPEHCPVDLKVGVEASLLPYQKIRLRNSNNSPIRVSLFIKTMEGGETISIITSGDVSSKTQLISHRTDGKRSSTEIIGSIEEG